MLLSCCYAIVLGAMFAGGKETLAGHFWGLGAMPHTKKELRAALCVLVARVRRGSRERPHRYGSHLSRR